jgi:hypothetical protein
MDSGSLDDIIARLLDVRSGRPGKQVQLSEAEIRQLCVTSKDIFLTQPNLLELEAPIKICGNNNNTSSLLFSVLFFCSDFFLVSFSLACSSSHFWFTCFLLRLRKNARLDDLVAVDQQSAQNRTVLFCFGF